MKKIFLFLAIFVAAACGKQEHGCYHEGCHCEETGHCEHEGCGCDCHGGHSHGSDRPDGGDGGCSGGTCKPDDIV